MKLFRRRREALSLDGRLSHIAFLMDGNGRWAKRRGLPRKAGHAAGAEACRRVFRRCHELGITTVTVYAFSTENWKRPKEEVEALMALFDRYLDEKSIKMFGDMGVYNKVEVEARTEVKWETYTKKIQIEARVLGDITMNNIIPVASKYESLLLDKAFKMKELGLNYDSDIELIRDIQNHTSAIQRLVGEMVEARKVANRVEDQREKAILYHDTVAIYLDQIRQHIDKLEEVIDDQLWPLPKYRELLFIR